MFYVFKNNEREAFTNPQAALSNVLSFIDRSHREKLSGRVRIFSEGEEKLDVRVEEGMTQIGDASGELAGALRKKLMSVEF